MVLRKIGKFLEEISFYKRAIFWKTVHHKNSSNILWPPPKRYLFINDFPDLYQYSSLIVISTLNFSDHVL